MTLIQKFLPRSLTGRVFAMFAMSMLVFLVFGLAMFHRYQFVNRLADTQAMAETLAEVTARAVATNATLHDNAALAETLSINLERSPFKSASFVDAAGYALRVVTPHHTGSAPEWLAGVIAGRVSDVIRPVGVGNRPLGTIHLTIDEHEIAAHLWTVVLQTVSLVAAFFILSFFLLRTMLRRWLENLERLRSYENDVAAGEMTAEAALYADAPIEIQEAIQAVNRSAASMRDQFGQRIALLMNSLVQHKSALDQAAIVCEIDTQGRLISVNDQFVRHAGLAREQLIGTELASIGGSLSPTRPGWVPSRTVWNGEIVMTGPNGQLQSYRTIVPIFDAGGEVEKYICIDIDITERKEFERAILENAKRQTLIAAFGQKALESSGLEELFRQAAHTAAEGLGVPFTALLEAEASRLHVIVRAGSGWPEGTIGRRLDATETYAASEPGLHPWSAPLRQANGIVHGADVNIFAGKRLFGTIGAYELGERQLSTTDIDFLKSIANILATAIERHDVGNRLTYLAQYDPLTSLPNRRRLVSCLGDAIEQAGRDRHACAVLLIDLDRFKNVNDTLGHGAGDLLLVQAGRRIVDCVRAGDVVARLGGDEFAIVLPEVALPADAAAVADKLVEAMGRPFRLQGQQIFVTASVGIATWPEDGADADTLIKSADTAMYSAKENGRNNYQFYLADMNESAIRRLKTEAELHGALERGEFELHYQPKVNLAANRLCGFEALLRWNHPGRGQVSPAEFISILEDTGLIIPVGEWAIRQACRQLQLWQVAGLEPVPVAINLSARQFLQSDLAAAIGRIVAESGVDPRLLEFEITESMLMTDPESAVATLAGIKAQGMRLSVDDFGTGYSSLAYLKRFPLDALKIDRTFVRDLPGDSDDAAITQAVISLAHHLSLKVVAEGVENEAQIRALARYECDEIQGYFVSKPLPAAQCARLLDAGPILHLADEEAGVAA